LTPLTADDRPLPAGTDAKPVRVDEDYEAVIEVDGESMRTVTWVRINEFAGGEWTIGGKRLEAADVHDMSKGETA